MTRRQIREHIFKELFQSDFYTREELGEQFENYFEALEVEITDEEKSEVAAKVDGAIEKLSEIDGKLDAVAEGWSLKRMGGVERSILRLAAYEIFFDDSIPERVAINEAVELAKKFGGDEAPAFVNGILAKLVKPEA